jgi:hypothetical protein
VDVGGRRDREVEGASPRPAAALDDRGVQAPALARRGGAERDRVECPLERGESLQAVGTRLVIGCDENPEVIVSSSPASARRSTWPTLLRSSFCGVVAIPAGSGSATASQKFEK